MISTCYFKSQILSTAGPDDRSYSVVDTKPHLPCRYVQERQHTRQQASTASSTAEAVLGTGSGGRSNKGLLTAFSRQQRSLLMNPPSSVPASCLPPRLDALVKLSSSRPAGSD
uniref:Uncharacterized protein n=1 Tax=Bionectria ochroleuca TaxID=29856 RepID=A0A8H7TPV1_BIOOC